VVANTDGFPFSVTSVYGNLKHNMITKLHGS